MTDENNTSYSPMSTSHTAFYHPRHNNTACLVLLPVRSILWPSSHSHQNSTNNHLFSSHQPHRHCQYNIVCHFRLSPNPGEFLPEAALVAAALVAAALVAAALVAAALVVTAHPSQILYLFQVYQLYSRHSEHQTPEPLILLNSWVRFLLHMIRRVLMPASY